MLRKDKEVHHDDDDDGESGFVSPAPASSDVAGAGPSFRYSSMNLVDMNETSRSSTSQSKSSVRNSETTNDVFIRGSLLDRNIEAVALVKGATERHKDYKGRIRVCWSVLLFFVLFRRMLIVLLTLRGWWNAILDRSGRGCLDWWF